MQSDVSEAVTRFLMGYGIAGCSWDQFTARISQPYRNGEAPFKIVEITSDIRVAWNFLSQLAWPATRHVAFPTGENSTAFVNNSRNGSDYADQKVWLACHLASRFARIVDQSASVWTNGKESITMRYEARIFELHSPSGELIRCVVCMNDGGRWTFNESGRRHPIENNFPYEVHRKRDRFQSLQLRNLAAAFRIPTLDVNDVLNAEQYCLLQATNWPENDLCTWDEADDPAYLFYLRGQGWADHLETHSSSLIADYERCLELNPAYEAKVRATLDRAYQILKSQRKL